MSHDVLSDDKNRPTISPNFIVRLASAL